MLTTITISLLILVLVNLILLKFSCNKTNKPQNIKKKVLVVRPKENVSKLPNNTLSPIRS